MADGTWRAQAPPPPPPIAGNLPASRLKSEIGDRRIEPPLCVQNAMMTKDKKPFTYTPGGIDLSEIKSPRMARRIERNANAPGVGELPVTTHTGPSRPLPPSALAAMQPALPVQVFPSGAPPPPPPPPSNAPPPPPPMQALPTKIVASTEGTFERPDMTRIIPENPMSLLRKTPKVERKTFLDELNDMENKNLNGNNKQDVVYAQPVQQQQQQQKQQQQPSNGQYEQSRPQFRNDSPPSQQQRSPSYQPSVQQFQPPVQQYQPPVQPVQQYQPPVQQYQPPVQQYQPPQYQPQPQYVQNSFQPNASNFGQQTPSTPQPNQFGQFGQNGQNGGQHKSSNIGSLYIPPVEQYQAEPTPPTPPQRHSQPQSPQPSSPLTPKLNPAPKPWQNQKREQEKPAWAQRPQQQQQMSPQPMQPMQPIQPMSPSSPMPPPPTQGSARITVMPPRITPVEMNPPPTQPGVERVYVTQPAVFQHPGPRDPNTRVIPVQVERTVPQTPERNLSRQQSWTPSQSNSFKVLQKMTNTEADDVDDDTDDHQMSVEHGPRNSQQFPVEQMRKMQVSNNDQFRSRQAPSSQPTNRQPTVRTIPIQIEGDDNQQQKPYVHPSQQPVQESQMYMGAAMPSRAFRMVQAMNEANSPGPGQSDM